MYRFYEKNPLYFALCWIGIYVVSFSIADGLSASLGVEKSVTAVLSLLLSAFLFIWLKKQKLLAHFGLTGQQAAKLSCLHYMPLLILVSTNLWGGVALNLSVPETLLYMLSMLCVGFLEELIFRGFLFCALCKDDVKTAVVISSLTFGIGHIVNLLHGAELLPTLLQLCYATAAGFLFTAIFHRWGSLWPCIATHSLLNALSAIAGQCTATQDIIAAVVLTVVALAYGIYVWYTPMQE